MERARRRPYQNTSVRPPLSCVFGPKGVTARSRVCTLRVKKIQRRLDPLKRAQRRRKFPLGVNGRAESVETSNETVSACPTRGRTTACRRLGTCASACDQPVGWYDTPCRRVPRRARPGRRLGRPRSATACSRGDPTVYARGRGRGSSRRHPAHPSGSVRDDSSAQGDPREARAPSCATLCGRARSGCGKIAATHFVCGLRHLNIRVELLSVSTA